MSNRVNQHQSVCLAYRRRRYREGRGRTAMGFHRGRPLTPLGARFHIVPKGWGGGRRVSSSAALSVGPTTAIGAFLPTLARRSQRGPREFC